MNLKKWLLSKAVGMYRNENLGTEAALKDLFGSQSWEWQMTYNSDPPLDPERVELICDTHLGQGQAMYWPARVVEELRLHVQCVSCGPHVWFEFEKKEDADKYREAMSEQPSPAMPGKVASVDVSTQEAYETARAKLIESILANGGKVSYGFDDGKPTATVSWPDL